VKKGLFERDARLAKASAVLKFGAGHCNDREDDQDARRSERRVSEKGLVERDARLAKASAGLKFGAGHCNDREDDQDARRSERRVSEKGLVERDARLAKASAGLIWLQAIATIGKTIKTQDAMSDPALREKVVDQLDSVPLAWPALINFIINDGNIELWEIVESESEKQAARVAAEATPGIGAVIDHLMVSRVKPFGE
jgi:hypothetical protein